MTALRFTTKSLTGCVLVTVSGELDIATKPELIHYVNNILSPRVGMVVLDLSGITFIDAQGLSALIMIKRQAPRPIRNWCLPQRRPSSCRSCESPAWTSTSVRFLKWRRRITSGSSTTAPSGARRNRAGNDPWPGRAESERRRMGMSHRPPCPAYPDGA